MDSLAHVVGDGAPRMVHEGMKGRVQWESEALRENNPLKAVWVVGVQIDQLALLVTEEKDN